MTDLLPIFVSRTNPTDGQFRRVTTAELPQYVATLLGFMPADSLLVRTPSGLVTPTLAAGRVFGRLAGGSYGGFGATELDTLLDLPARLATRAPFSHGHTFQQITDIVWGSLAPNRTLAFQNGEFRWIDIPTGGSGTVTSPLTADFNLGGFRVLCGPTEVLRCTGGEIYIGGVPYVPLRVSNPQPGDIIRFGGDEWENEPLTGALISITTPGYGGNVQAALDTIRTGLAGKAALGHTHPIGEILGVTPGKWLRVGPTGALEEVDAPSGGGGGGLANPLTVPLDIAAQPIVSGARQLLRYQGGELYILDQPVFPSLITGPTAGEVPVYDEGAGAFVNRRLAAPEVVVARPGFAAGDLEEALDELAGRIEERAPGFHVHPLSSIQGTTEGKFVVVGPGPNFPLVEVDPPSGGSGGPVTGGTLTTDLDIAGFAIRSGARELIRVQGGTLEIDGREPFPAEVAAPAEGHVAVYDSTTQTFRNRFLGGAHVLIERNGGGQITANDGVNAAIDVALGRAPAVHGHAVADIIGQTTGKMLVVGPAPERRLIEIDPPTGINGGTLTSNLDIAAFSLVSGARELLRVQSGTLRIDGREVFPSEITAPEAQHVPIYDEAESAFVNRFVAPSDIVGLTPGKWLRVSASGFLEEVDAPTFGTASIDNKAVTGDKIADDAVSSTNIAPGAVTAEALAADLRAIGFDGTHYTLPPIPETDPQFAGALWADNGVLMISQG